MPDFTKRATMWINENVTMLLTAASNGQSGQQSQDLGVAVRAKVGANLFGMTLVRSFVNGWWRWDNTAASSPLWGFYSFGLLKGSRNMDDGDFADIGDHDGDLQLFEERHLLESAIALDVMYPREEHRSGSGFAVDSRSQRRMDRLDDTLWIVAQKSIVTEQIVTLGCNVTTLWKLP